jgi:glyoxylase-like metal-dependent hydrolase (beta-lactamase superfamily II)
VVFHDGDAEGAPGITVHKVGGHSRGLQCVRVMTATRPGRARLRQLALLRELREGQGVSHHHRHRRRASNGYDRLKALAASPRHIVPGHDPLVLQRYPALNARRRDRPPLDVARLER